jgi:hypothetical protein
MEGDIYIHILSATELKSIMILATESESIFTGLNTTWAPEPAIPVGHPVIFGSWCGALYTQVTTKYDELVFIIFINWTMPSGNPFQVSASLFLDVKKPLTSTQSSLVCDFGWPVVFHFLDAFTVVTIF